MILIYDSVDINILCPSLQDTDNPGPKKKKKKLMKKKTKRKGEPEFC